ncbi:uncharacterized protein FA14DRAFT_70344 [Meira miltonrushii]|uniref:Acyl-CoA thioesterase-like N-terminal HotDog domain-containing protein n=1 Tax=Meira miltonrushii TaxID=1280837 RepID=A0A316V9D4_9BASI|nr:uncharacterized protein FA14DRAFT_70344 [Meira miltonrushii]PWN34219.1 hypothetical protein FA14DRAFT_70344 [Meira miltonrushii]
MCAIQIQFPFSRRQLEMELKAPISDANRILRHLQLRSYKSERCHGAQWSYKTLLPPLGQSTAFGGLMVALMIQAAYQTFPQSNAVQYKVDSITATFLGSIPSSTKVRLIVHSIGQSHTTQSRHVRVLIPVMNNGKRTWTTRMTGIVQLSQSSESAFRNGSTPSAFVSLTQMPSNSVISKVVAEDLFGIPSHKSSKFANPSYAEEDQHADMQCTLHHLLKSVPNIHSEQLQTINSRSKQEGVLPITATSIGPTLLAFTLDNCIPGAMSGLRHFTDKAQNTSGSIALRMRFSNTSFDTDTWNELQALFDADYEMQQKTNNTIMFSRSNQIDDLPHHLFRHRKRSTTTLSKL